MLLDLTSGRSLLSWERTAVVLYIGRETKAGKSRSWSDLSSSLSRFTLSGEQSKVEPMHFLPPML